MKSDDLLKRDFHSNAPLEKCITDITEIPVSNGKLYVSAIFDRFDLRTNMKADLCIQTLENALTAHPGLKSAVIHIDGGTPYTSESSGAVSYFDGYDAPRWSPVGSALPIEAFLPW